MTNYERDHLQPDDSKETQTTECERCSGDGWIYSEFRNEDGDETTMPCLDCNGKGYLEY